MQQQPPGRTPDIAGPPAPPPLGRRYDVGGRQLLLHRSGIGSPAVVFLPGAGLVGLDFLNVHDRAGEFTTSVIYDRAGTGWSDRAGLPRSAAEITGELRELLHVAAIPAPYLLVGHSMAGVYVRHYARCFPDEVAGLLLLDPYHEDNPTRMPKKVLEMEEQMTRGQMPPPPEEVVQSYRGLFEQKLAQWPDDVRELLVKHHLTHWDTGVREMGILAEIGDELRHANHEADVPMIVISAMGADPFRTAAQPDQQLEREISDVKLALHAELAASTPAGEHRVLDDAGHNWIHVDRPDAVLQAIRDLLGTRVNGDRRGG